MLLGQMLANLLLVGLEEKLRWQDYLPLHLCHLALFLCAIAGLTRKSWAYELAYFWGLGGTMQGLLTPDLFHGFPALECVFFFLGHGGIVGCVIFLTLAFRLRPTWRSVVRSYSWLLGYAVLAGSFDAVFHTNYGFLCAKPATASLFDWLGPWPWYIVSAAALGGVVFVLLYLPWAVADRSRRALPAHFSQKLK